MKCLKCGRDNNRAAREANGGRCESCNEPFVFDPKEDGGMTDVRFANALSRASAGGQLKILPAQLWYQAAPRHTHTSSAVGCFLAILVLVTFITTAITASPIPMGVGVALGCGFWLVRRNQVRITRMMISRYVFSQDQLQRWTQVHGPEPTILPSDPPHAIGKTNESAPDLTAYSFDRVLVVEHDELAAMLVANNFHVDNRCVVLGFDGYPTDLAGPLKGMLRRNPRLEIYALHDASPEGCGMILRLRDEDWFPDRRRPLLDLGLWPRHVFKPGKVLLPEDNGLLDLPLSDDSQALVHELAQQGLLDDGEIRWLETRHHAELYAVAPERLISGIRRRMGQVRVERDRDREMDSSDEIDTDYEVVPVIVSLPPPDPEDDADGPAFHSGGELEVMFLDDLADDDAGLDADADAADGDG